MTTFEQARAELKEIAGGQYRSLRYELTEDGEQVKQIECRCYVDPSMSTEAKTWREALDEMKIALDPALAKPLTADEAPIDDIF